MFKSTRYLIAVALLCALRTKAGVLPTASCAEVNSTYTNFVAHFGYFNASDSTVVIPREVPLNFFQDGPTTYPNQPTSFLAGANSDVFTEQFSTAVAYTWKLDGNHVTVTDPFSTIAGATTLPLCPLTFRPIPHSYSGAGTHPSQNLAAVEGDLSYQGVSVTPLGVFGGDGGVSVANVAYAGPDSNVTGDVTVTSTAAGTVLLALQLTSTGTASQIAYVPITVSSASTTCGVDVTSEVSITLSGLHQNIATKQWTETIGITNTGSTAINGPATVVLENLSAGAALVNSQGNTSCFAPSGAPYLQLSGTSLAPQQGANATLTFTNSQPNQSITFTPRVASGGNSL